MSPVVSPLQRAPRALQALPRSSLIWSLLEAGNKAAGRIQLLDYSTETRLPSLPDPANTSSPWPRCPEPPGSPRAQPSPGRGKADKTNPNPTNYPSRSRQEAQAVLTSSSGSPLPRGWYFCTKRRSALFCRSLPSLPSPILAATSAVAPAGWEAAGLGAGLAVAPPELGVTCRQKEPPVAVLYLPQVTPSPPPQPEGGARPPRCSHKSRHTA